MTNRPIYVWNNVPKLIIQFSSPISRLHDYLTLEYIKAGRNPMESTYALGELFNGNPKRLTREFGVEIKDKKYLLRLGTGNLHPKIVLGFYEIYCKELLAELQK